jgi:hypothetical protein
MPQPPTLRPPAPTWWRMRTSPATTCWWYETSLPPPMTSRTMAPLERCPRNLTRVCRVGLLWCTRPGDVLAIPRLRGLLVRLLRHLQRW